MRQGMWRSWIGAGLLLLLAGCADNALVLKGKVQQYEQQQANIARQFEELKSRAGNLDKENQELQAQIAQTRQETKVAEEQLAALRDELRSVNARLAEAQLAKQTSEKRVQAMEASLKRQGSVTITPNNSFLQTLPAIHLPDISVRRDGDVIRVVLSGNRLFEPGTARLRPGGTELVAAAANELLRTYPDQIIGIEGHTDNDPVAGNTWRNNQELSVARALVVYDVLTSRTRLQKDQLFVVGQGANRPLVSNATPEGKQRNRRIELVVYPEKIGQ
jgi:flagellar motor protein MotB